MPNFNTVFSGAIILEEGSAAADPTIVFGTCMLGSTFGKIEQAQVRRTADQELLKTCSGNLLALLLKNPRAELTMTTLFTSAVTAPGLGAAITIPLAGLQGHVLDATPKWSDDGARLLDITATGWDSLQNASAYQLVGGTTWEGV